MAIVRIFSLRKLHDGRAKGKAKETKAAYILSLYSRSRSTTIVVSYLGRVSFTGSS